VAIYNSIGIFLLVEIGHMSFVYLFYFFFFQKSNTIEKFTINLLRTYPSCMFNF